MNDPMETSPTPPVRVIGVTYLCYFLAAFVAAFLMRGIVVAGDGAATARHLLDSASRYQAGFALGLGGNILYIAVTVFFYRLFASVDRTLSLVAACISLVGCTVQIGAGVFQLAPLVVLRDAALAGGGALQESQAVALLSLKLFSQTYNISLVLFAVYDLALGYLIVRSTFLPQGLGAFLMVAGAGWLTFLWPPLATALSSVVLPLGALAELALMVWLLARGVDTSAWRRVVEGVQ